MPIDVSELRQSDLDDALAFALGHGSTLTAPQVRPPLSLLARHEGVIVGVVLHAARRLELVLAPDQPDAPDLARTLIDKALLKMRSQGIATARITPLGDAADQHLWTAARWPQPAGPAGSTLDAPSTERPPCRKM